MWLSLQLQTHKATAILTSAKAPLSVVSKRIQMVVKCEFSVCWNVFPSKDADSCFSPDRPLLSFAVRITAVINETCVIRLPACIYHQAWLKCEHIEVSRVVLVRLPQPLLAHLRIQNLTNVFNNEITCRNVMMSLEPPPPAPGVEWVGISILALHHTLVLALFSHWTSVGATLEVTGTIDTCGIIVAWVLGSTLTDNGVAIVV